MAWVSVVARLVLGGVWIAAGYLKIADPAENVRAVRAYDPLPLDESGPEVAKEFHDALFVAQPPEGGPGLSDDRLVQLAADAGADSDQVGDDIRSLRFRQWVRNATDAASRAGISQTPTIRVDGEDLEGAQSMDEPVGVLEQRVREASGS